MKKIIMLTALGAASIAVLASCGSNSTGGGSSSASLEVVTTVPSGYTQMSAMDGMKEWYEIANGMEEKLEAKLQEKNLVVTSQKELQSETTDDNGEKVSYVSTNTARFVKNFRTGYFSSHHEHTRKNGNESTTPYQYDLCGLETDGAYTAVADVKLNEYEYFKTSKVWNEQSGNYVYIANTIDISTEGSISMYRSISMEMKKYYVSPGMSNEMQQAAGNLDSTDKPYLEYFKNESGGFMVNYYGFYNGEKYLAGVREYQDGITVWAQDGPTDLTMGGQFFRTIYKYEFTDEEPSKNDTYSEENLYRYGYYMVPGVYAGSQEDDMIVQWLVKDYIAEHPEVTA